MYLNDNDFRTVIQSTPLVSIDLIIKNSKDEILLGERVNRPAQNFWFVPGGRILKMESIHDAFQRLTLVELGQQFSIDDAKLLGPYDHFYSDCVFGPDVSTHYVAIAYELLVGNSFDQLSSLPKNQHGNYRWSGIIDLLANPNVHVNTKAYFNSK